jgi:hypothetical protein
MLIRQERQIPVTQHHLHLALHILCAAKYFHSTCGSISYAKYEAPKCKTE